MKIIRNIKSSPIAPISYVNRVTPEYISKQAHPTNTNNHTNDINDVNISEASEVAIENVLLSDNLEELEYYIELLARMGISQNFIDNFPVKEYEELNPHLVPLLKQLKKKYETNSTDIKILGLIVGLLALLGISAF